MRLGMEAARSNGHLLVPPLPAPPDISALCRDTFSALDRNVVDLARCICSAAIAER